jgi:hypothetical protein
MSNKSLSFIIRRFNSSFKIKDAFSCKVVHPNSFLAQSTDTFEASLLNRHDQAKRTIMIKFAIPENQLNAVFREFYHEFSYQANLTMCSIFHFKVDNADYALIEFNKRDEVSFLMKNKTRYKAQSLPVSTRSLLYDSHRYDTRRSSQHFDAFHGNIFMSDISSPNATSKKDRTTTSRASKHTDFDQELTNHFNHDKSDEVTIRIKFFIASIIEDSMKSIFAECLCLPFGSTINGMGTRNSDLDLQFYYQYPLYLLTKDNDNIKFTHQTKTPEHRQDIQTLRVLSMVMSNFIPLFQSVYCIENAVVPIVEFKVFGSRRRIDCDITVNMKQQGYLHSKLFWTYTKLNAHINLPKFVYLIKTWAVKCRLTRTHHHQQKFSSFHLIMMSLHFLITIKLLPDVTKLILNYQRILEYELCQTHIERYHNFDYESNNVNIIDTTLVDKAAYTSLTKQTNMTTLNLFENFLKYYLSFDYSRCISLDNMLVKSQKKLPFFISNPLMPSLNVANIDRQTLSKLVAACSLTINAINSNKAKKEFDLTYLLAQVDQAMEKKTDGYEQDSEKNPTQNEFELIDQILSESKTSS